MGAVTVAQSIAAEAAALAKGWTEEQLVDCAGDALGNALGRFFTAPGTAIAYLGKGHNAADAMVALRVLRDRFGWKIAARIAYPPEAMKPISRAKWHGLGLEALEKIPTRLNVGPLILLDGLLGTGASGPLRSTIAPLAQEMADLRSRQGARVAAVDLPSGMAPDTGTAFSDTVIADITFMIANAKHGLLLGKAASVVGALAVVPLEILHVADDKGLILISPQTLDVGKSRRAFDFHKGMAGRISILAGSESYTGAAVLAATGALRGGGGLITLFVPKPIMGAVTGKCPPEIIVRGYNDAREILESRFDALVVGCGLGEMGPAAEQSVLSIIESAQSPVVIDADALNMIAKSTRLDLVKENHVITPHPGEFARLAPDLVDLPREEAAAKFAERVSGVLLLKGSRTIIAKCGEPLRCNSTGSPGMASGGQGDLLAGVIGALLATGEVPVDAASLAPWLCGRAAEIALTERGFSEESLTASGKARFLGGAFEDWKTGER